VQLRFHGVCARAAASELRRLAEIAVNEARVTGLARRMERLEKQWESNHGITKREWLEQARLKIRPIP